MKLNLYEDKNTSNEHVDVYYANMRPVIRQIIDTVNSERPSLQGRPADEELDDGEEILLDPREIYYLDHIDRKLFAYTKLRLCARLEIKSHQHLQDKAVKA